jgi:hypothetical protein
MKHRLNTFGSYERYRDIMMQIVSNDDYLRQLHFKPGDFREYTAKDNVEGILLTTLVSGRYRFPYDDESRFNHFQNMLLMLVIKSGHNYDIIDFIQELAAYMEVLILDSFVEDTIKERPSSAKGLIKGGYTKQHILGDALERKAELIRKWPKPSLKKVHVSA